MVQALDKTIEYVYNGIGNIVSVTENGTATTVLVKEQAKNILITRELIIRATLPRVRKQNMSTTTAAD